MLLAPPPSFILLLGEESVLFYAPGEAPETASAPTDPIAFRWAEQLAAQPKVPLRVLFDGHGQEFVPDTLPRVNILDRPGLVNRRLDQHLPGTGIRGARRFGVAPGRGGRESWLFAGLTNTENLEKWRGWLEDLVNPLPDFSLLPVELADLALALRETAPEPESWTLLVLPQRLGGYRHIALRGQHFVFSRLTPFLGSATNPLDQIGQDLSSTLGYLARLDLNPGTAVEILVGLRGNEGAGSVQDFPVGARRARLLPLADMAARIPRVRLSFAPAGGEDLAAAALMRARRASLPLSVGLLRERLERDRNRTRIYIGRTATGAGALLAGVLLVSSLPDAGQLLEPPPTPLPPPAAADAGVPRERLESFAVAAQREAQLQGLLDVLARQGNTALGTDLRLNALTAQTEETGPLRIVMGVYSLRPGAPVENIAAVEALIARLRILFPGLRVTLGSPSASSGVDSIAEVTISTEPGA